MFHQIIIPHNPKILYIFEIHPGIKLFVFEIKKNTG